MFFGAAAHYTISIVIQLNKQMQFAFQLKLIIVSSIGPFLICDALRDQVPFV